MRFAYADPPYPGQAKRWYGNHPDYAGEVDHEQLVAQLEAQYPDGWVLSTSAAALQSVLAVCPATVRIAVWHVTNSEPPGNRRGWHLCWEPVIVNGGRPRGPGQPAVRNLLACGNLSGSSAWISGYGKELPGQKPPRFIQWLLELLGYQDGDTVDDLFPGSGACARGFAARAAQPQLEVILDESTGNLRGGAPPADRVGADFNQSPGYREPV